MMTSSTSAASTEARDSASLMAMEPRSCAATEASAPLNEPTGVRAALAMTMEAWLMVSSRFYVLDLLISFVSLRYAQVKPEFLQGSH